MEDNTNLADEEFEKCWACGSKVRKARIEKHHVLGRIDNTPIIPLCILCHDLVDRIPFDKSDIFEQYFINCYNDLIRMDDNFKWTKIFMLKCFKITKECLNKMETAKDIVTNSNI